MTENSSGGHLGWRCAAELTGHAVAPPPAFVCGGGTTDHPSPYVFAPFPVKAEFSNRYFHCDIEPYVGAYHQPYWSSDAQQQPQQSMQEASSALIQKLPSGGYGVVCIVYATQHTDDMAWYTFPTDESLFHLLLVAVDGTHASHDGEGDRSSLQQQQLTMWREACVLHGYDCILYDLSPSGRTMDADPIAAIRQGALGILRGGAGTLIGVSRVAHILGSTLWPASLRRARTREGEPRHLRRTPTALQRENGFVVVAGSLATFVDALRPPPTAGGCDQSRYVTLPFGTLPESRRGNEGTPMIPPEEIASAGTEPEGVASATWILCNRYYSAVVRASVILPTMCAPSMRDLLTRQAERLQEDPETAWCRGVGFVCWPPHGTSPPPHESPEGSAFRWRDRTPPLAVILRELQRAFGIDDVVLLTCCPLTAFEERLCESRRVEVVVLPPGHTAPVSCSGSKQTIEGPEGVDRLHECLHCTSWGITGPPPLTDLFAARGDGHRNRCLVSVVGGSDAAEEEAWAQEILEGCLLNHDGLPPLRFPCTTTADSSAPYTLEVKNRYLTASVGVEVWGGARARLADSQHLPARWEAHYEAIIIGCSRRSLERCRTAVQRHHQNVSALASLIQSVQRCLYAQQQADLDAILGSTLPTPETTASTRCLTALLYVVDGCEVEDADLVASCLHDIVAAAPNVTNTGKGDSDCESQDEAAFPLMECVFGRQLSSDRCVSSAEGECGARRTEGLARLREALLLHPWSTPTTAGTGPGTTGAAASVETVVEQGGAEEVHVDGTFAIAGEEEPSIPSDLPNDSHPVSDPQFPSIGCELPPTYLVDPFTSRSQHVSALQHYQDAAASSAASTCIAPLEDATREAYHEELIGWINRMKEHGATLSRALRQRQAEVLALALESAMS